MLLPCPEPGCSAPAECLSTFTLPGVGFGPRGTECLVTMHRTQCVVGHICDAEDIGQRLEMPPEEEE